MPPPPQRKNAISGYRLSSSRSPYYPGCPRHTLNTYRCGGIPNNAPARCPRGNRQVLSWVPRQMHDLWKGIGKSSRHRQWIGHLCLAITVGLAYFLAAQMSLVLLTRPDGVAVFWPAAGISSGTLIALGPRARVPVTLG